jgi:anti-sigma factor RsiW
MTVEHTDVGAYALGLLEEDDRRAFEEHLDGCGTCAGELAGFTGLRGLLAGVGPVETPEDPSPDLSDPVALPGPAGLSDLAGPAGPAGLSDAAGLSGSASPTDPASLADSASPTGSASRSDPASLTGSASLTGAAGLTDSAGFADLVERRRRQDRRRRRGTIVIGLAAGVALVAGGVTAGSAIMSPHDGNGHQHGSPAADVLANGVRHSATDPSSHAAGTVATRSEPFGTEVGLDLANLRGPLTCRLVAVLRSGQQQPVTEWAVPPKGYGVPGSPGHLQVHGGIAAKPADISRFDVLIEGGGRLVTIPV